MTDTTTDTLTIALSGASGLVGSRLHRQLITAGHRVIRLVRFPPSPTSADSRYWNPDAPAPDLLDNIDVLVHLAGKPILGRFTKQHQRAVKESRVAPTRRLAELVAASPTVQAMVCASAVGYYGYDLNHEVTELTPAGTGFLAEVCTAWEAACDPAREVGKRVVTIRTGIVLDGAGGILKVLTPLTKTGLNGPLAGGKQWFAWVGAADLCSIYQLAITDTSLSGPVNAVGPELVTNAEFTRVLGTSVRRPTVLPIPRCVPALLLGSLGAKEFALASQKVIPKVLKDHGYQFQHATLRDAICAELQVKGS